MASSVWYEYPIDNPGGSYGQIIDPLGNYLKPDVNVAVPSGTPITALTSGTVTNVTDFGRCCGGLSITVAMDNPINSLATHVSYNFLGRANVAQGQRIYAGEQIATAGSPYGIDTAVGLTPDNQWGNGSFHLNATGNPMLDPHLLLNPVRSGTLTIPQSTTTTGQTSQDVLSNIPIIGGAFSALQSLFVNFVEEVGIFLLALVLVILGVMLLAGKQIGGFVEGTTHKAAQAGEVAAVA